MLFLVNHHCLLAYNRRNIPEMTSVHRCKITSFFWFDKIKVVKSYQCVIIIMA